MSLVRPAVLALLLFLAPVDAPAQTFFAQCGAAILSRLSRGALPKLRDFSSKEFYSVSDPADTTFAVCASVENSILAFSIQTVNQNGKRSQLLNAEEQIDLIFNYFQGQFTHVESDWTRSEPGGDALYYSWPTFSVNLNQFNEATGNRLSPETAAFTTWTGRQMLKRGFIHASVIKLEGEPGAYESVRVRFRRDER